MWGRQVGGVVDARRHGARRAFIGNLYKKVKDPNLVGLLSGHSEGNRAFAHYRDIDEDMKKKLVRLLEQKMSNTLIIEEKSVNL